MNRPVAQVSTSATDPRTARTIWTMARADNERAFRAARRHSGLVRFLRKAVPALAVLLFAGALLTTYLNPLRWLARLPVDIGSLVVSGTKITMEAPRISGFTQDNRAYELTARAAAQDLTKPDLVELKELQARIDMQDKTRIELSANTGIYDSKSEMMVLRQNILLVSSTGYSARLSEASIDVRKGNVVSEKPVSVDMLNGTLNANTLEVVDAGDIVRFGGGVAMVVTLEPDKQANAGAPR
jgi:lipopolysaccharide export system protein LptC